MMKGSARRVTAGRYWLGSRNHTSCGSLPGMDSCAEQCRIPLSTVGALIGKLAVLRFPLLLFQACARLLDRSTPPQKRREAIKHSSHVSSSQLHRHMSPNALD